MTDEILVADATRDDLPGIAAIYTHFVLKTTVTFNTSVRTPAQWLDKFETEIERGPYEMLVAREDGNVLGYVQTSRFRPHEAYSRSAETSIYVAPDQSGRGVGGMLYERLFERLARTDIHRAYAVISLPNETSVSFHERFGFVHRGTLTEAGNKFGRWLDVAYFERALTQEPTR